MDAPVELRLSHASPRRLQTNRTLSDSAAILHSSEVHSVTSGAAVEGRNGRPDLTAGLPPIPPPRMRVERRNKQEDSNSPPRLMSNGLPPTPKVHMGACFMKVRKFITLNKNNWKLFINHCCAVKIRFSMDVH